MRINDIEEPGRKSEMKMECEVLEIKAAGSNLRLTLQGRQKGAAAWREWCSMSIDIPATEKAKKAFHIGRLLTIQIQAE
jgi:uncharacterized protein YcaQ